MLEIHMLCTLGYVPICNASSLLRHLERQWGTAQCLGPCTHLGDRKLQALAWPSPEFAGTWGVKQRMEDVFVSPSVTPPFR